MDSQLLGLLLVTVLVSALENQEDTVNGKEVKRIAMSTNQAFSYAQVIHNHAPSVVRHVKGYTGSSDHHDGNSRGFNTVVQTVTKEVPYPVLQPYAITVEKHVPYAVSVPVAVPVDRPYPVAVPRPYLVQFERPVPVPVHRPYPYPVKYPVEVKVPVPTPVPVPVAKPYPVYLHEKGYDEEPANDDYSVSSESDHE